MKMSSTRQRRYRSVVLFYECLVVLGSLFEASPFLASKIVRVLIMSAEIHTYVITHKLLQVGKQVVFALLVPSCCITSLEQAVNNL